MNWQKLVITVCLGFITGAVVAVVSDYLSHPRNSPAESLTK